MPCEPPQLKLLQQHHPLLLKLSLLLLLLHSHLLLPSLAESWPLNHAFTLQPLNNPSSVPFTSLSEYNLAQAFLAVQGSKDNASSPLEPYLSFVSFDGNRTFYLCIYVIVYTLTSDGFIAWIANRNSPIVGQDATLTLLHSGDLQLRSSNGTLVWSTGTANMNVQRMELTLSPANLVLYNADNVAVWQSVEYPTDTLTVNQFLQPRMELVSWNSPTDPSNGSYSLVMEPGGLALYDNFFSEPQPYWIWGFSGKNDSFSVMHRCTSLIKAHLTQYDSLVLLDTNNSSLPQFCAIQNETVYSGQEQLLPFDDYASGTVSNHADSIFLRLSWDGMLSAYYLSGTEEVPMFDALNKDSCFLPRFCGSYGLCSSVDQYSCSCPYGFVANNNSDSTKGCSPDQPVDCNSNNTFIRIAGIDYFSTRYLQGQNLPTEQSCQANCIQNCSCLAALWHDLNKTCFLVTDKIGSLRKVDQDSYVAYLKMGNAPEKGPAKVSKSHVSTIIAAATSAVTVLLLLCCLFFFVGRKFLATTEEEEEDAFLDAIPGLPTRFSYNELQEVTNGFSRTLGKGGFGTVYEGTLANSTRVAVKQLEGMRQGNKEFRSEVAIMGAIHHFNILRLLGFCVQGNHRLLVYEYMENGSLDQWLFNKQAGAKDPLSWEVRFKIALGVARGLAYLHDDCRERIIHLDVKPQNILLDGDFVPKVADMGLSRLIGRADSPQVATTMRGTPGYLAPEWLKEGVIDTKCDVFSYGMLLMEIVSGRKNLDHEEEEIEKIYYPQWAFKKLLQGNEDSMGLTNAKLEGVEEEGQLRRMLSIAFLCVVEDPAGRPLMERVVQMLEGREAVNTSEAELAKLQRELVFVLRSNSHRTREQRTSSSSSSSAFSKPWWSSSTLSGRQSELFRARSSSSSSRPNTEMAFLSAIEGR